MRVLLILPFLFSLSACVEFPDVDQAVDDSVKKAPYPDLLPVEQVLGEETTRLDENSDTQLEGRANGLRRRAEALRRQPVE